MKSGKQRQAELKKKKAAKRFARVLAIRDRSIRRWASEGAPVDVAALAPNNSYGVPDFVRRGYYLDVPFQCIDCGKAEVWTAAQQKWWYEVAKGYVYSTAVRCRPCRQRERERREASRGDAGREAVVKPQPNT